MASIEEKIKKVKEEKEIYTRKIYLSYIFAIFLFPVGIILGKLLTFSLGDSSYFFSVFPSIAISAWYGNIATGFITAFLSALGIDYLLLSNHSFIFDPIIIIRLFLFLISSLFISYLIERDKNVDKVTEYKKKEKENIDLILELHKQNKKAEEEIKARDEFLSIASHELKTPLTSMLLQIQTSLHNIRHVSLAEFSVENLLKRLDGAEQQSKRVVKMINDLLNVSLITTGKMNLEKEEIDLALLTKQVLDSFEEKIKEDHINVTFKAEKPIFGEFDNLRIEQAVTNLLTNALRYGDRKPIKIRVDKHGKEAVLIIKDEGIGIPENQLDKIFEKFERGENGKNNQGLGVGLYITNQIIRAHHGKIEVESTQGQGTTFILHLPLRDKKE